MDTNTYVECMTKPRTETLMKFMKILCIMLCVGFFLMAFLIGSGVALIAFIIAIAAGVGVWFFNLRATVEFEYQYIDRELSVDKIYNKSRRKHVASYDIGKMEILAPANSHHLDEYRNRELQMRDYASGQEPEGRAYVMIMEGKERLLIEPSEGLVKAIKNAAPRKVFTD